LIIASVQHWLVDLSQDIGSFNGVDANNDAVGIKEVRYTSSLAQEFGIGNNFKQVRGSSVHHHDSSHPLAGIHGHGALPDNHLVIFDASGDLASHGFNIGKIGFAIERGRCSNSYKHGPAGPDGFR
jgi:hypothetical protein